MVLMALLLVGSRHCRFKGSGSISSVPTDQSLAIDTLEPSPQPTEMQKPPKILDMNTLLGKIDHNHDSLAPLDRSLANRNGMFMHHRALDAFRLMHEAAAAEGIQLTIISAFRSFDHQKRIWEDKWNGRQTLSGNINATSITDPTQRALEILRFSAMPGTSRHHWGTDIDINSLNNSYFSSGRGLREYQWLQQNAPLFGFCQPYTSKSHNNRTGYEEEKWHWSYMPASAKYLENFRQQVQYSHITGFSGYETAPLIQVISHYVLAIDEQCLNFSSH